MYKYLFSPKNIGDHGGFSPFPPLLEFLNPNISPTIPPGFGIGHSPLFDLAMGTSSSLLSSPNCCPSFDISVPSSFSTHFGRLVLLLVLVLVRVPSAISSSAYAILGAGHGKICGRATTKKLAKSVVANKEDVTRLRGWRCGGMTVALVGGSKEGNK
jgi:hypothetical protein